MIKNLICLENNKVSVIRLKDDKLEFIKKDGEIEFPITADFWEWWKRSVQYILGEQIDLCFVYDKNYDLLNEREVLQNNIINTEASEWKVEHIKSYFWELKPTYLNITIVGINQQEYILGTTDSTINTRKFCTNLEFEANISGKGVKKENKRNIEEPLTDDDYSIFAKYFIDLIRRERG